ncbi:MAG: hypothetical protein QM741_14065 [Rudaea sp.]|uniref:hypothetical protein n=1 Tax=Rudaea sp. TaxID=2136325 RepID=UPI0039E21629
MFRYKVLFVLVLFAIAKLAAAQGGPPLVTDDPGTPGNGKWEINLASIGSKTFRRWDIEALSVGGRHRRGTRVR